MPINEKMSSSEEVTIEYAVGKKPINYKSFVNIENINTGIGYVASRVFIYPREKNYYTSLYTFDFNGSEYDLRVSFYVTFSAPVLQALLTLVL